MNFLIFCRYPHVHWDEMADSLLRIWIIDQGPQLFWLCFLFLQYGTSNQFFVSSVSDQHSEYCCKVLLFCYKERASSNGKTQI